MTQAAIERIQAAVELNPDRSRVTIRRDDARAVLVANRRLTADVENLKSGAILLETMCGVHCRTIEGLERDVRAAADQRLVELAQSGRDFQRRPSWLELWCAASLIPIAAFAGVLAGHG